jgi:hypothetical protein
MKKVFKVLGYLVLTLVLVIGGLITYVKVALPNVGPAPELKVDRSPEKVERGKYLANHVTLCVDCHSTRDWSKFSGPMIDGTIGKGGETFDQKFGFPGAYYSRNITPYGIARYTDGELYRVITTGVTREGRPMFPVMPYTHYGKMDPDDIYCIIAYIRSLESITNDVPPSVSDFPMSIIINMIPKKAEPTKRPPAADIAAYGAYLVNASGCIECHTKDKQGQIIPELAFSGGREFKMPDGSVIRSSNITPDVNTGIGAWTKDIFLNRFRTYADSGYHAPTVEKGQFNTIMPWTMYARMTEQDLAAIYNYLHNLKPIANTVNKYSPPGVAKN